MVQWGLVGHRTCGEGEQVGRGCAERCAGHSLLCCSPNALLCLQSESPLFGDQVRHVRSVRFPPFEVCVDALRSKSCITGTSNILNHSQVLGFLCFTPQNVLQEPWQRAKEKAGMSWQAVKGPWADWALQKVTHGLTGYRFKWKKPKIKTSPRRESHFCLKLSISSSCKFLDIVFK